ncbi:acyltransferase [Riemerella anatipestifer]|nr:acyltransferase [Riemerella anatipestifer]MDY3324257.1 acyltransferase [Riemerella anatipestifer]MDY3353072.1 acyltransferase [Riemerella anatipestifer]
MILSKIFNFILYLISRYKLGLVKNKGKNCIFKRNVDLLYPENVLLGDCVQIEDYAHLNSRGGSIWIEDNSRIGAFVRLSAMEGSLKIGKDCTINPFTIIDGYGKGVKIGDGVRVAAHCMIISSNHIFTRLDKKIFEQGLSSKGIIIGDDVWIGTGCKILDGVTIGKGSVIAANSVVTKDVPDYSVMGGVPARIIRKRE